MEPTTMLAIAGIAKGVGQLFGAIGQAEYERLKEFNLGTEKVLAKAQGIQSARLRNEAFKEAKAINDTIFLSRSDEITRSQEAFYERQLEKTGEDISNINLMTFMNQLKYTQEIGAQKTKARTTLLTGILEAGQTGLETYAGFEDAKGD